NVKLVIKRAIQKANIKKRVTCHIFRHSIATHMLAKDINLRTIQQYLGHRQIQTTQFYTHVAFWELKRAGEKVLADYTNPLKLKENFDSLTTPQPHANQELSSICEDSK
ncbi:MAG: tyrosine-type recombinase/integrase, partial [Desulfobacterota bacterium]|nr:tyrosine-type recombinase/integrase [Thermodesulfobacteriota bacterium]MDW8003179.1 tyrosine-type recombinase/integrase [Deltaproteobacteria bacterium]